MTGLWIFIGVAVLVLGYVIYKRNNVKIREEKEFIPAPPGGDGGVSDAVVFIGEANPSAPDCTFACENPILTREYSARRTPLQKGDVLYNGAELQEPTNGNGNWIALTHNNEVQVVKIDTIGIVIDKCDC